MCGKYLLPGGLQIEIYCELIDPFWWKHPDPAIDFTKFVLGDPDRGNEELRGELTAIGGVMEIAGKLGSADMANRLGAVAAEIGNGIAQKANLDVQFEWTAH